MEAFMLSFIFSVICLTFTERLLYFISKLNKLHFTWLSFSMGCGHMMTQLKMIWNSSIRQAEQRSFFQGSTKDSIVPVTVTQLSVEKLEVQYLSFTHRRLT